MKNSKEKIAILGANSSIVPLIKKAKELGYETHVFAWQCGAQGELIADVFHPISLEDRDDILQECKKLGVAGVCSVTSDFAAPVVSYVANKLGLIGNPDQTGVLARNKFEMRKAFQKAGIYTPSFAKVYSIEELDVEKLHFPVIVKPTDRWSSKGVTRVNSLTELKNAIEIAANESLEHAAIVEEYLEGPEYSAECICYRGEKNVVAFTRKETTGFPHYIETGHIQPSDLSEEIKAQAQEVIMKALDALMIQNGAAHVEFKVLPTNEIGIIEIGARMGGDCIGTDLTCISTGMDYLKMVIDVACGRKPDFSICSEPCPVRVKFIVNENDYQQWRKLVEKNSSLLVRYDEIDCDFSREVRDSSTRHGFYIVKEN